MQPADPRRALAGWDVGGSQLKVAWVDAAGSAVRVRLLATPLWQGVEVLQRAVEQVLVEWPQLAEARHVVTMTAELCDIFASRAEGVGAVVELLRARLPADAVGYYSLRGWLSADAACRDAAAVASANWHATLTCVARRRHNGILLDVGGTTTDVQPFVAGRAEVQGYDDAARLRSEELVYTGVVRTPVMALCRRVPVRGAWVDLAAEHFADMADVYRLLSCLPAACDLQRTADGAGRGVAASARRLARMVGMDVDGTTAPTEWVALARYLADEQAQRIRRALARALSRCPRARSGGIVGAGAGRFLARRLAAQLQLGYTDFTELAPLAAGERDLGGCCASAVALALLARELPPVAGTEP